MAKCKAKIKNHTLLVKARLSFGEKWREKELDIFTRKYIRGLLKVKAARKGCIEYTGPIGISLEERLKKPISRHDFYFIMEQIVDVTQKLEVNRMSVNDILFDMKYVYINETTKEMQFVYLPLETSQREADVIGFIETIIYSAVPVEEQDNNYISEFTYFIKGLSEYRADAIEKYIIRVDYSIVNTIKKHNTGSSGFITDKPEKYYQHYEKDGQEEATALLNDEEATTLLNEEEATTLLNEEEATALLNESVHYASLFRISTEETIEIDKAVFRIGKERSYSDYFVSDNDKVSRSHADIIIRNGNCYVIDQNSRNRTFVNDQPIPVQQEIKIVEGDRLRLANEEFIFHE